MDEVPEARQLDDDAAEQLLELIDPTLEFRQATPAERGFCSVYRIEAIDDGTARTLYLKASPDGQSWAIPDEARLQAVLHEETAIPVPAVLGVVDEHDSLPTPCYLMTGLPGEELPYEQVARLEDDVLRRLARETGEYLAKLHSVPAVDRFGHVRHDGPELVGDRPTGDPATLTVGDADERWQPYLRDRVNQALDRHEDSRFSALTPALSEFFEAGIENLEGAFEPAIGRNDHGLHNLLLDADTGAITGMIDWGYTLAVPPAFDVEFAAYLYSGAFLAGLPEVSDRRPLVREAMLSGYRETAPELAERVVDPEPLYEALAMTRIMNDFEHLTLPEGSEAAVMDRIRTDVRALIE